MSEDSTEQISLKFEKGGYNVSVDVLIGPIVREIRRMEEYNLEEITNRGFERIDMSKFSQVQVEPTDEKWGELADRYFEEE